MLSKCWIRNVLVVTTSNILEDFDLLVIIKTVLITPSHLFLKEEFISNIFLIFGLHLSLEF